VVQLCVRFHPAPGGVETHVLEVSKVLKKRGHEVRVFTSDLYKEVPFEKLGPSQEVEEVGGIPIHRFRAHTLAGEMHYILTPSMIKPVLRSGADVLHAHSYGYFHVNLATLAKKMTGVPFVFTTHFHPEWSMWGGDKRKMLRKVYDRMIGGNTLAAADIVVCVSTGEAELLKTLNLDEEKLRIVPNGVDMSNFTPMPDGKAFRKAFGIEEPFILYAGRLASNKGLDHLVRAFSRIHKEKGLEDLRLVLVGEDMDMRAGLEKLTDKEGLQDKVTFTGHIKDDDLFRSAYGACEVFALPSDYEAFGIVLLEAMCCQKPCVASRTGGVPDVIDEGRTGLMVDYGDVKGLARALTEVLSDRARAREMGKAGRKRVEERFTWESITTQLEKIYRNIIG
jgi:glycosyltransferase involved in cell wall biosynthesis